MSNPGMASLLCALVGEIGFTTVLFIASKLLPGRREEGAVQENGGRRTYVLNGLSVFLLAIVAVLLSPYAGIRLGGIIDSYWSLFVAANLIAFTASGLLLWSGHRTVRPSLAAYFYGSSGDPALFGIDLKLFSYRPSLIGLAIIDLAAASHQAEAFGHLSATMTLYLAMHLLYIANYFQFEYGMLFTWDIIEERFGWMLVWGDYVLVPFFYSLPALAQARTPTEAPVPLGLGALALYSLGFWMFRGANQQKHDFKRDPTTRIWGKPARALGGRLLVSGFWGIGRKLNYTGELCLYLAWTALAAGSTPVVWVLPAWLAGLLIHRTMRDDGRCRQKYGALWQEYCRHARFRMIPFLY
jgi:Delta14-sterol reductase